MAKLWEKNYSLDSLMEKFTVGKDYLLDYDLVLSDVIGSAAHADGIAKIGILSDNELSSLIEGLTEIAEKRIAGKFDILPSDEDCHTAIENYLTEKYGDTGKKIHTGRSRNDQVLTALRLYMREAVIKVSLAALDWAESLICLSLKHVDTPMPGRTHMQIAMPSSVALWACSFAEEITDEVLMLRNLYGIINKSPLGSAASYGVTLPLDREYTAALMGFDCVQNNVLYANNSRGKYEAFFLDNLEYISLTASKIAEDLLIFTLPEFGYFSLPDEFCSGSSIMPQKKNPDGLELVRSRSAVIGSLSMRVKSVIRALPSGYNRDFQDTKEAMIAGYGLTSDILAVMKKITDGLTVHADNLIKACTAPLYATDKVMEKVAEGVPFRDGYRDVGLNLDKLDGADPVGALHERTSVGTTGNLCVEKCSSCCEELKSFFSLESERLSSVYSNLIKGVGEIIIS